MQNSRPVTASEETNKEYSQPELIKFLNYIKDKNLVKSRTVDSWISAASNLLSDPSEAECNDVRTVDIDLAVHRAANRPSNTISPSSLRSYRTRTKRAIEEFVNWKSDPASYRPRNFEKLRTPSDSGHISKSKSKNTSASMQPGSNGDSDGNLANGDLSQPSGLNLSYPLRPDFLAQIVIPKDLNQLEAKRLGAFILTLSSDYQPE